MLLARSVIAWALPAGVSADTSCALALATEAGIGVDCIAAELSESSAAASSAFLLATDLSATLPDLWCAYFFRWWCLAAAGAVALSVAAAAWDGAPRQIQIPVVRINAARPLAVMVMLAVSPFTPPPETGMRPLGMSAARQKKGILGRHRAKTGQ